MINFQGSTAVRRELFDDWRQVGIGEQQSEWTGCTVFTVKRAREETIENTEDLSNEDYTAPTPQPMQVEDDLPTDVPSSLEYTPAEAPQEEDTETQPLPEPAVPVAAAPTEVSSTYGPIRETPLTRAMRQDLSRLDTGRRTDRQMNEVLQTEVELGDWTDHTKQWRISWEEKVLIRLHAHQKGPYRPCEKSCPIPLQWLTGCRHSLIRQDGVDGYMVITDEDYRGRTEHHPELRSWTGYSVFEIELPDLDLTIPEEEHETYEVTMWEGLQKHKEIALEESKRTEVEKLLKYKALKVIPPHEARLIRQKLGHRILPSRFVITEKPDEKEPGKFKKKARWCIRGYLDPDLHKIEKQAPTLTNEALSLVLQVSASMDWTLNIGNVEGAFLQGDQLCRKEGALYIEPPPGGMPGIAEGSLLLAEKAIYGLADAPKAWHHTLTNSLLATGLVQSCLDPCLFHYWHNKQYIAIPGFVGSSC